MSLRPGARPLHGQARVCLTPRALRRTTSFVAFCRRQVDIYASWKAMLSNTDAFSRRIARVVDAGWWLRDIQEDRVRVPQGARPPARNLRPKPAIDTPRRCSCRTHPRGRRPRTRGVPVFVEDPADLLLELTTATLSFVHTIPQAISDADGQTRHLIQISNSVQKQPRVARRRTRSPHQPTTDDIWLCVDSWLRCVPHVVCRHPT